MHQEQPFDSDHDLPQRSRALSGEVADNGGPASFSAPHLGHVPSDLCELRQWVAWRAKPPAKAGGKLGKVPVSPHTGRDASTTDPTTWGTLDEALSAATQHGLAGIGFVFTKESGIVGVDLDKCRDPATGAIEAWAQDIVATLNSYTEVSPSGAGLHVYCKGEMPEGAHRLNNVEMYCDGRFFTVTGARLEGAPETVGECSDALRQVHEKYLAKPKNTTRKKPRATAGGGAGPAVVQQGQETGVWRRAYPQESWTDEVILGRARDAANGVKFSALFDGDASSYASESEADMALCSMLAFWTGPNEGRLDQLFRRSKLLREKWDELHGSSTYGQLTIRKALDGATFYGDDGVMRAEWVAHMAYGKGSLALCASASPNSTKVQLRCGERGHAEFVDSFNVANSKARTDACKRACKRLPQLDAVALDAALESLAVVVSGHAEAAADCADGADGSSPTSSIADQIISMVVDDDCVELFHTPGRHDAEAYATITDGQCRETYSVRGRAFRYWVIKRYREKYQSSPSSQGLNDGLNSIAASAVHDGDAHRVHVRVAGDHDATWLDLADDTGRAVHVDASGWRVVPGSEVPVRFLRRGGMQALPEPVHGGSIDELRPFVNLPDERGWILFTCAGVTYLLPDGPYVVLIINGEQGSAKSTTMRALRALIDPNKASLRRPPRDEKDLMIAANNAWIVAYDNISNLPNFLSDSICSLATGGGFGSRQLYTDDEEKLFEAMRPVMLNGIEDVATRPDLLDRAIILTLPVIPDEARKEESEQRPAFEAVKARVLGALLDGVSTVLRMRSTVRFQRKPRMADFAVSAVACASTYGWSQAQVLDAIEANRSEANEIAIGNSLLAEAIVREMEKVDAIDATATQLLELLSGIKDPKERARAGWPATPRALRGALNRVAPSLRRVGIHMVFDREGHARNRMVRLSKVGIRPSAQSAPSANGLGDPASAEDCGRYADGWPSGPGVPSAPNRPQNPAGDPEKLDSEPDADGADRADSSSQTLGGLGDEEFEGASTEICERCGGDDLVVLNDGSPACRQCDAPEVEDIDGGAR